MTLTDVTFTRAQLQYLPEKRRRDAICNSMGVLSNQVIQAATSGKMFHIVDLCDFNRLRTNGVRCHPPQYIPTDEDLVEGFKATFPDCKVEYTETWEDTQPGLRKQKKGILVDWS